MGYLLRFGVFELNLVTEELRKFDTPIKLPPQPFKVLALLASQAGQVVTREQIQLQVWGEETYVDFELGMNQCIKQIRNVLSDSADTPRYIETLPRRGYRFIAPVEAQVLPSEQQQLNIRLVETTRPVPDAAVTETRSAVVSGPDTGRATAAKILPMAHSPATVIGIPEHTAATTQAGRNLAAQASSEKRQDRRKILVVAAVLLFGAGVGFLTQRLLRQNIATHRETLVVLPFEAAEQDSASNALARGLSESITGKLVQAHNQGGLEWISAREARDMGVKTAEDARRRLQTDYVLEGSVEHVGDRVQVSSSLVDSRTHRQVGARTVTGDARDLFALEDQVVEQVLEILPGENPPAKTSLARAGAQSPGYEAYLRGRGYLLEYEKPENLDSAIADFNHALTMDPNFAPAHAGLGQAYWIGYDLFNKGKTWLDQSSIQCAQALKLDANLAEAHTCMGHFYNVSGKYDMAVQEFRRSVELDADDASAWRGLGRAYDKLDKTSEAEAAYKKAIELRPHYWAAYNWLGVFYFQRARYSEAVDMLRKAIELAPENHRLYGNLGGIYVQIGRYDDAIAVLRRSIELRPTMNAYSNLGTAYFYTHRFNEAAETYRKATELDDQDWLTWGNLGDALYWTPARRPEAVQAYQTARKLASARLSVNPNDASTAADVAVYSAMLDDKHAAFVNINRALSLAPDNADVLFRASLVYNHFGEDDNTLASLKKALEHGFPAATIRDTPDFDHLHDSPAYVTLIAGR
jgi:tetratricopeptide (TPR) repeat protein/DNA-binding winged helix-turn-helix (wHTH) protein